MQVSFLPLLVQVALLHVLYLAVPGVESFSVRPPTAVTVAVTGPRWTRSQSTGDILRVNVNVNVNPRSIVSVVPVRTSVGVVAAAAAARPSPEEDTEHVEDGMIGKEEEKDSDDDDDNHGKFEMATELELELELEPGDDDETEDSTDRNRNRNTKKALSALPPLPEYLNHGMEQEGDDSSDSDEEEGPPQRKKKLLKQSSSSLQQQDETNRKIEEQQRQIDLLMQLVKQSNPNTNNNDNNDDKTVPKYENNPSSSVETETKNVMQDSSEQTNQEDEVGEMEQEDQPHWFLSTDAFQQEEEAFFATTATDTAKTMAALPRIVCEQMQRQQTDQGWSTTDSDSVSRPVEIVRASVFTSYRKDTNPSSHRVRMYEEMKDANYDVHMMETLGKGEKCVDIQIAVEMLHYATVPNAYDVAILLSGDKDFIPAMVRTRQKGRRVGVVSMRTGCNKALYESPHATDYDIVWIDDFLDRLIVPMTTEQLSRRNRLSKVSAFTIMKIIYDFVATSKVDFVSSRDIGRYLKTLPIVDTSMLEVLKEVYGGLRVFLVELASNVFVVRDRDLDESRRDPRDKSFMVGVYDGSMDVLLNEAKLIEFSKEEKQFLFKYDKDQSALFESDLQQKYYHTLTGPDNSQFLTPREVQIVDKQAVMAASWGDKNEQIIPCSETGSSQSALADGAQEKNFSKWTVKTLKEKCRERGLLVSGTKA
eukprot:scaffold236297_cov57-Attheya_sp.AAC.1